MKAKLQWLVSLLAIVLSVVSLMREPRVATSSPTEPHKFGGPALKFAGDLDGSTMNSQVVTGLQGEPLPAVASGFLANDGGSWYFGAGGGGGSVSPGTAGQIFITNATPATAWTSLISLELTHGRFSSGNGGSDVVVVVGPCVGSETSLPCIYLLPHGVAATANNFGIQGDGTNLYLNTVGATGGVFIGQNNSLTLGAFKTSSAFFGGTTGTAPIVMGYGTTPTLQSGSNATSFTMGTGKVGATYSLVGDNGVVDIILGNGTIDWHSVATTTSSPSAGGAGALPATPAGYASISVGGVAHKIAYY